MTGELPIQENARCVVIVAHPDDETLWAGGTILAHPDCQWTIVALCRKSDPDRAPKFSRALEQFGAGGDMADLDDGPEQKPLPIAQVEAAIISLLPGGPFDIVLTHSTTGEYTQHRRHEEVAQAVLSLWNADLLVAREVWAFAYEDGDKQYLPRAIDRANLLIDLPRDIWQQKYRIITEIYGFRPDSFEAKTTPRQEAFWRLGSDG